MQTATVTRFDKGQALYQAGAVRRASNDGLYIVKSATNAHQEYTVRIGERARCECKDFQARGAVCKHQLAAMEFEKAERAALEQRAGRVWTVEYYTLSDGRASVDVIAETREQAIAQAKQTCDNFDQVVTVR
jgi:hypothetical protein